MNKNTTIFIQENEFENGDYKLVVILSQPQCDDKDMASTHLPLVLHMCVSELGKN